MPFSIAQRGAAAIMLLCFTTLAAAQTPSSATYNARNLALDDGCPRAQRAGDAIFCDEFRNADAWSEIANYRELLSLRFGELDSTGAPRLLITRAKVGEEETDTAWRIASRKIAIAPELRGREFVLRTTARASKRIEAAGSDGDSWRGAILWRNERDELIKRSETLFSAQPTLAETTAFGTIPEDAANATIQIGCDVPNVTGDEFVAIYSVALEVVNSKQPYPKPADFISEITNAADSIAIDAEIPEGGAVLVQIVDVQPDAFNANVAFAEHNGAQEYVYKFTASGEQKIAQRFDSELIRYKVTIIPNGRETPTLRSVRVGEKIDRNWSQGGDAEPPVVKFVGGRAVPNPDPKIPLEFELRDASIIRKESIEITVDERALTDAFEILPLDNGALRLREREPEERRQGLHRATLNAADVYGNAVQAVRCFYVGDPPKTPNVTLRDDGTTLIDGKPFFPIGIYGVTKREFNGDNIEEAFRGLKEAGFNFAHSYSMPRSDEFLAAAEKFGFKLWSVAREPDERFVEIERHCPAIIAWYLGDDTSYNTRPEELLNYHESVKAVDPTRITVQADPIDSGAKVTRYRPYVDGTDAFLPEIYPVRDEGEDAGKACVAQTIRDVRRAREDAKASATGVKAIWPIIQYFQGWGWKRFPTNRELRAMSFAALAAGANGITWYTYGGFVDPEKNMYNYGVTTSPERWQNISNLATQIQTLSPALLEPTDLAAQPKVVVERGPAANLYDEPAVVALYKRLNDVNYVIAVNSAFEPVDVRFVFPSPVNVDISAPELIFQDENDDSLARPKFDAGTITDSIERFGVRVYRWKD